MASDAAFDDAPPGAAFSTRMLCEAVLAGLLLLVFVGLQPFKPVPFPFTTIGEPSTGDGLLQVLFVLLLAVQTMLSFRKRSLSAVTVMPPLLMALLGWCLLSASWSAVPDVTIRRAGLQLILAVTVVQAVDTVGPERSFTLLRHVLVAVLLVNWVSIFVLQNARHMAGEDDPALAGDWRGLYIHKNIAGAVSALTVLVCFPVAMRTRRWRDVLVIILAIGFLIGSRSKTSAGFLPLAMLASVAYLWGWRRNLDRSIVAVAAGIALVGLVTLIALKAPALDKTLADPQGFTGRSLIWLAEGRYISDHPLFGSGYGTFADTGASSPLADYMNAGWVGVVSHGHNGYLQLLVTIGGIGFTIAMLEFAVRPLLALWPCPPVSALGFRATLAGLFVFIMLHDLLETDFLDQDGPVWTTFLMVLASLRERREAQP